MEPNDKLPEINQDYPESDVSDNQRLEQDPAKTESKENKSGEMKGTGADIENLPEIVPARTSVLG